VNRRVTGAIDRLGNVSIFQLDGAVTGIERNVDRTVSGPAERLSLIPERCCDCDDLALHVNDHQENDRANFMNPTAVDPVQGDTTANRKGSLLPSGLSGYRCSDRIGCTQDAVQIVGTGGERRMPSFPHER